MTFDPLNPPRALTGPFPAVVPFTVRENPTQQYQIERIIAWIRDTVVPFINDNVQELGDEWATTVTELIENWETLSQALIVQVQSIADGLGDSVDEAQAARDAAEAARDLAEMFASDAEALQDAAVTALLQNLSSDLRTAADQVYAPLAVADVVDDLEGMVDNGRLSESALEASILSLAERRVSVDARDFGAVGDGVTDDTDSINAAVSYVNANGGGVVSFPAGVFMVNPRNCYEAPGSGGVYTDGGGIIMRSNVHLELQPDTIIRAMPVADGVYKVVQFRLCDNASITGGTIEGERSTHTGTGGEWGHVVAMLGSTNIHISNVKIKDGWGDGITVTYVPAEGGNPLITSRNITIRDCVSDNNRRQGASIIGVTGLLIDNCDFINTNGTLPESGLDLEPNAGFADVRDVVIRNSRMLNNARFGLAFYNNTIENVTVEDCVISGNQGPTQINGASAANGVRLTRVTVTDGNALALSIAEFWDLKIRDSHFDGDVELPYSAGFRSLACRGTEIAGNRINGTLRIAKQEGAVISSNYITPDASGFGIEFFDLVQCRSTTIEGNVIDGGAVGIAVTRPPRDTVIRNNKFYDQREAAIRIPEVNTQIVNNVFHSGSLNIVGGAPLVPNAYVSRCVVRDNMFYAAPRHTDNNDGNRPRYALLGGQVYHHLHYKANLIVPDGTNPFGHYPADINATNGSAISEADAVTVRPTTGRPANPANGMLFFDTTLNKMIVSVSGAWVDMNGVSV